MLLETDKSLDKLLNKHYGFKEENLCRQIFFVGVFFWCLVVFFFYINSIPLKKYNSRVLLSCKVTVVILVG